MIWEPMIKKAKWKNSFLNTRWAKVKTVHNSNEYLFGLYVKKIQSELSSF